MNSNSQDLTNNHERIGDFKMVNLFVCQFHDGLLESRIVEVAVRVALECVVTQPDVIDVRQRLHRSQRQRQKQKRHKY